MNTKILFKNILPMKGNIFIKQLEYLCENDRHYTKTLNVHNTWIGSKVITFAYLFPFSQLFHSYLIKSVWTWQSTQILIISQDSGISQSNDIKNIKIRKINCNTEAFSPEVLHKNSSNLVEQISASTSLSCLHLSAIGNRALDHSCCCLLMMLGSLSCGIPAF